jgi:hypothetical protein
LNYFPEILYTKYGMNVIKTVIYNLIINLFINVAAYAKITDSEFEKNIKEFPVYPQATIYDLKNYNIRMKVHLTEASFEKVTTFYVAKLQKMGWKIVFPDPLELKTWMEALYSDKTKTPNIMLSLTKPKTKFNCNITIGVVKDARSPEDITIITIYLTDSKME